MSTTLEKYFKLIIELNDIHILCTNFLYCEVFLRNIKFNLSFPLKKGRVQWSDMGSLLITCSANTALPQYRI